MAVQDIDITQTTTAAPAAVWALLGDSATWPQWTTIGSHAEERAPGPDGLGEIRVFTTGRIKVREEIVERVPERRLTYALLSGLPVRDYRAVIDLTPTPDGGTTIRWHTTFRGKVPGTAWFYRLVLNTATKRFVAGLVEATAATSDPG